VTVGNNILHALQPPNKLTRGAAAAVAAATSMQASNRTWVGCLGRLVSSDAAKVALQHPDVIIPARGIASRAHASCSL
jgi:hypothetical protein